MQVIEARVDGSPKVVELTDAELVASDYFHAQLDEGLNIYEAVKSTQMAYPHLSTDFLMWLQ